MKKPSAILILFWRASSLSAAERPNAVFILADDLGYGDAKAFGGKKSKVPTPHFDRLCKDGIKFTNAHATDSVCVPEPTSIMTGATPSGSAKGNKVGHGASSACDSRPASIPWGRCSGRVDTDGHAGKWHLGTRMTTKDGKIKVPRTPILWPSKIGPTDCGFDHLFLPGSLDMFPYAYIRGKKWQGPVQPLKRMGAFNRVGPAAEDFLDTEEFVHGLDEAGKFIRSEAKKEKPFSSSSGSRLPTLDSPEPGFEGKSPVRVYGDFVMNTDACIGPDPRTFPQGRPRGEHLAHGFLGPRSWPLFG